jgi:hydroxypyruvate isomerase
MLKVDVLFDVFWNEISPEERIPKIAECGYRYVETWLGGDAEQLKSIGNACKDNDINLVSIVMNFATDDTVAPVRANCLDAFLAKIDKYSDNALAAGCNAGIVTTGNLVEGMSLDEHKKNMTEALRQAGELAAEKGFNLNLEPLNTLVDHAGYYLDSREDAVEIVKEVALENVKILYDIYHMEIMTGNQIDFITKNIDCIGHFHSAGVPGRHELFSGETNYPFIMKKIEEAGYDKYFGLEYMPELESGESLRKTMEYLS